MTDRSQTTGFRGLVRRIFGVRRVSNAPLEPWEGEQWQGRCGICGKLPCDYHGHYPVPVGEV